LLDIVDSTLPCFVLGGVGESSVNSITPVWVNAEGLLSDVEKLSSPCNVLDLATVEMGAGWLAGGDDSFGKLVDIRGSECDEDCLSEEDIGNKGRPEA